MSTDENPVLPHGGYGKLRSYKVAAAVYDATVVFCRRFFAHDRKMTDQMVQAARSRVRNISEGSGAAATSRESEVPQCPCCGKSMILRKARQGAHAGKPFWGCSEYPKCRGTRTAD